MALYRRAPQLDSQGRLKQPPLPDIPIPFSFPHKMHDSYRGLRSANRAHGWLLKLAACFLAGAGLVDSLSGQETPVVTAEPPGGLRAMQHQAIDSGLAEWAHWGIDNDRYSNWTDHSNRLVPVYTFGLTLDSVDGANSVYRNPQKLEALYGRMPEHTVNPQAEYFDQTDIYRLQQQAVAAGKKYIIVVVFDGMDWQTTWAAAIYRNGGVAYQQGRGKGLEFQDYDRVITDFGYMVTSPCNNSTTIDVNCQVVVHDNEPLFGGYNADLGGEFPWSEPASYPYLISEDCGWSHAFTDSAASATSMFSGIKSFNGAINVNRHGQQVVPLARQLQQERRWGVGVVTSVPVSHATAAAAYANNVTRDDFQDLTRDMLGIPSVANRSALQGVDVLLGCGWGKVVCSVADLEVGVDQQGRNFEPGNRYLTNLDLAAADSANGGRYTVVTRTAGRNGTAALARAARQAVQRGERLLGLFGCDPNHLPYATADGDYCPAPGISELDEYSPADLDENPTLADMTRAALAVLEQNENGFWLVVEPGDVDWANHQNNLDNAIGAVFSGEAAFREICRWAETNQCWDETAVIVTADHGHLLVLDRPEALAVRPHAGSGAAPAGSR